MTLYDLTLVKNDLNTTLVGNTQTTKVAVNNSTTTLVPVQFKSTISENNIVINMQPPALNVVSIVNQPLALSLSPLEYKVDLAATGPQGALGESAYDIAVLKGFVGTQQDFYNAMTGIVEQGTFRYVGIWHAGGGVYPSNPVKGNYYKIGTSGVMGGVYYSNNDGLLYTGSSWDKFDNAPASTTGLDYIGAFSFVPTVADLGTNWKLNVIYKNVLENQSYLLRGEPLAWQPFTLEGISYSLIVESSNGTIFKKGQGSNTLLSARLFRNGSEVTMDFPGSNYKWRRVSMNPRPPPNDDATWNAQYSTGYRSIIVSVDDVEARATFSCEVSTN